MIGLKGLNEISASMHLGVSRRLYACACLGVIVGVVNSTGYIAGFRAEELPPQPGAHQLVSGSPHHLPRPCRLSMLAIEQSFLISLL